MRYIKFAKMILIAMILFMCAAGSVKAADVTPSPNAETPSPDAVAFSEIRVTNLHMISYDSTYIEFGWEKLDVADGYEIWLLDEAYNSYNLIDETEKNEYKLSELTQGTAKSFLVRPYRYDENKEKVIGNFSELFSAGTKPDDVEGLKVNSTNASGVELSWNKVSEDASYAIYRILEGTSVEVKVALEKDTFYTDTSVSAGYGYTYKVYSYVNDTAIRSDNTAEVITATPPKSTVIKQYKGGDSRARLRWSTVASGTGYIVYMRTPEGLLSEVSRTSDIMMSEYIQMNLLPNTGYKFVVIPYKSYNGTDYYAEPSNEVSVTTTGVCVTSTKAAVFKTNKKLKKSKTYKKYAEFTKKVDLNKSIIMPGVINTNVYGFAADGMVTQSICCAGDYILISAYDSDGEENSVVYVVKRNTGKYITTLVMPDAYHVGGIVFDGINIWISAGTSVSCFTINDVNYAVSLGQDAVQISYKVNIPVAVQASFLSYYNNILWVGEHKEKSSAKMYGYKIINKETAPVFESKYTMTIPSRTQDVEFINKKNVIISRSNQTSSSASKYYISRMEKYKLNWKKSSLGKVALKKCTGKITMPPMMEGIAYRKGYMYISFESACISSCPYKIDRICTVKSKKLKWRK